MDFPLPDLKRPPFHVVLLRWPRDGDDWVHPDDRQLARSLLPSDRVFRCEGVEGPYNVITYGHRLLRIEPVLWQEVPDEGLRIGDQVEVLSRWGKNWPRIAVIQEIRWRETQRTITYQVRERTRDIPTLYAAEDLKLLRRGESSSTGL
jgi:hypothetical protein